MASGKAHDRIAYLVLLPVFLLAYAYFMLGLYLSCLVVIGAWFGGIYLSPDLDTRSRPFYRWGLFRFIWWPYQWAIKHRSSLSHGLFVAPVFRLIYFSAILILIYFAWQLMVMEITDIQAIRNDVNAVLLNHSRDFLYLGIGVWIGSLFHVGVDAISSFLFSRR
jgi:uncharacterized metal-binding protein